MTTDEILENIDRSLVSIATEREQLLAAHAQLIGPPGPVKPQHARAPRRSSKRRQGRTLGRVLGARDPNEPRTAGDIDQLTGVGRAVAGSTLSRLAKQGKATKAARGYLRAAATGV